MIPKEIEKLIKRAYKAEGDLQDSVSEIAKIAQQYTDIELYGTCVDGDGPVIGWTDKDWQNFDIPSVISPRDFFERVSKLEKGQKLLKKDLKYISI